MNRINHSGSLLAAGLLLIAGTAGAETYAIHKVAEQSKGSANPPIVQTVPAPPANAGAPAPMDEWSPWREMEQMQAQIDHMFDETFHRLRHDIWSDRPLAGAQEVTDVSLENQRDQYVVKADLPGSKESNINVALDGRLLTISAQVDKNLKQEDSEGHVTEQESYQSSFQRAFTLPGPVRAVGMHSQYDKGVLTITIPKANA
jgi:HSP20 family protein